MVWATGCDTKTGAGGAEGIGAAGIGAGWASEIGAAGAASAAGAGAAMGAGAEAGAGSGFLTSSSAEGSAPAAAPTGRAKGP